MKIKSKTQKIAISGVLIAFAVVFGTFSIPIGVSKISPIQHFVNVIGVVALGPLYGVAISFITAIIRNILGTGTLLAFTAIIGPVVAGFLYKKFKKTVFVSIGEVLGSGVLGSLAGYEIATLLLGKEGAVFMFLVPFFISTLTGAIAAYLFLKLFIIKKILIGEDNK